MNQKTKKLAVAVDCSWFGTSGIGRFAEEIVSRCPEDIDLRRIRETGRNVHALAPLELRKQARLSNADVFWSPGFIPAAWCDSIPQAITVHDLAHLHHYTTAHRLYYQLVMRPLLRRVPLIFTVSEFSRSELIEWAGLSPECVVAVPHGLSPQFGLQGDVRSIDAPYILYVGNRRPYKNLPMLFRAFARTGLQRAGFALALSGEADAELARLGDELGIGANLRWLGLIPETELAATYRGACAVAFVSLYEGFGFPIIEAMGCGVPVVTSNVSAMPEVAGGAAELVDPRDCDSVTDGLRRICLDSALRSRRRAAGIERAASFDWDTTAATYWNSLAELGAGSSRKP